MAGVSYLLREEPERKEQRRLRALGTENIQKGDFDLAIKYYSESFEVIKDVMSPIDTIHEACDYATRWEILQQYEAALPYYQTAMKRLKAVEPISDRCVEGVMLMDRMAQCYHRTGRHETAEKMFKQAIRLYEKYHGEFSASNSSGSNGSVAAKLEGEIINVFLHYAQLLVSVKRDNEVADMRQRFTQIVRGSQLLRSMETTLLEKFDDLMALYAIREKRRRRRDGEERNICGRWDGFYVSKKSVKIALVLGTARNAKSKRKPFEQANRRLRPVERQTLAPEYELSILSKLDEDILNVFLHYTGDFDLATKYYSKSFKVIKNFLSPIDIYAALCEELKRYEAALPYYQTAMKNLKDVNPISDRYVERLNLLGCTAHCYHQIGRHETADKMFKQAISLYEKYRGEFSVSSSSGSNGRVVGKLDGVIVIVFLHYAQLLAAMERGNEVTDMRQSLTQIVRDSSWLWSLETAILDQFDDLVALQAIREKRRRGEGHDMVQQAAPASAAPIRALSTAPIRALSNARDGRSDGFYVSKKAVKMTLVLGAALTGALLYLERENADRKKIRYLLELSQLSLEKGDIEQSMREREKAYDLLKRKFPQGTLVIAMAMMIGASYEKTEQFTEAIPFYTEALKNVALETRLVHCEDLRVLMLDRLGQCYKQTGDPEAAVEHFKQAIEAYDQLKGKLSLSSDSDKEPSILAKLDEDILNTMLLTLVDV
ncbi:hypothetical protein JG688_00004505 [Phytophthora aleatoria]|uniref:Tetratricopeptide repeat protein n=1 Tax=Phytophthora aleatoria TaxID=2496075 RepID=A0A8J5J9F2_9STRA|nr:hypothetical protein JG688_00004505 [Phytophthora aleatoria]